VTDNKQLPFSATHRFVEGMVGGTHSKTVIVEPGGEDGDAVASIVQLYTNDPEALQRAFGADAPEACVTRYSIDLDRGEALAVIDALVQALGLDWLPSISQLLRLRELTLPEGESEEIVRTVLAAMKDDQEPPFRAAVESILTAAAEEAAEQDGHDGSGGFPHRRRRTYRDMVGTLDTAESNMILHTLDNGDGSYSYMGHIVCEHCDYCAEYAGPRFPKHRQWGMHGFPHQAKADPYELQNRAVAEWEAQEAADLAAQQRSGTVTIGRNRQP